MKIKLTLCCGLLLMLLSMTPAWAQDEISELKSSYRVGWRKGYASYDQGCRLKLHGKYAEAIQEFEKSRYYFQKVREYFPNWSKDVVISRIRICDRELAELRRRVGDMPPDGVAAAPTAATEAVSGTGDGGASSSRLYTELNTELELYKARLSRALGEIDELNRRVQQSQTRSGDVEAMQRDYRELREKYALLEAQNAALRAQPAAGGDDSKLLELRRRYDGLNEKNAELQKQLAAADADYAATRRSYLAVQQRESELNKQLKRLENELKLAGTGDSQESKQLNQLKDQLADLRLELKNKNDHLTRTGALLDKIAADPEGKLDRALLLANQQLEAEVARLNQELNARETVILERRLSEQTAKATELSDRLARSEQRGAELESELKTIGQRSSDDAQIQRIHTKEAAALRGRVDELLAQMEQLQIRYDDLKSRYDQRTAAAALAATGEDSAGKLAAVTAELAAANAAKQELITKLTAAEANKNSVRDEMIALKAQAVSSEIELKKLAVLRTEYDKLSAELTTLKQRPAAVPEAAKLAAATERGNRLEAENQVLKRKLERAQSELTELDKNLKQQPAAPGSSEVQTQLARAVAAVGETPVAQLIEEADKAAAQGNGEVAIWAYKQALSRDAQSAAANLGLGRVLLVRDDFAGAYPVLLQALAATPDAADVVNLAARAAIGKGEYPEAIKLITDFKAKHTPDAALNLTEALACARNGQSEAAEAAFKAVLQADDQCAEAAIELAQLISADDKRLAEAARFYRQARELGIAPDSLLEETLAPVTGADAATAGFVNTAALEALAAGDRSTAEWYLKELSALDAESPAVAELNAQLALNAGNYEAALKFAAKLPEDYGSRALAALAACGAGNAAAAAQALNQLKPLDPAAFKLDATRVKLFQANVTKLPDNEPLKAVRAKLLELVK